ncbi:MAG: dihydroneopterin aldolase [bacterium]
MTDIYRPPRCLRRGTPRRPSFCVDLEVMTDDASTGQIGQTVDYRGLAECILEVGHGRSVELIETLATHILDRVFARFAVQHAAITVRKKATGVPGDPEWVGVRLHRSQT